MKSVTARQKSDFLSNQRYITLAFSGGTTLTNDNIVLDSLTITRTLSDSEQVSFGTVFSAQMSVDIVNDGVKYEGQTVTVTLTAGTYTANLGTYTVFSTVRSNDRLYRNLVAYDKLQPVLRENYSDWHNGLGANPPSTIKAYRDAFFSHIGITQQTKALANDNLQFTWSAYSGILSGGTILGEICNINGTFGYLDVDQTFKWHTPQIDESTTKTVTITMDDYYIGGLACEEFVTSKITQVHMHMGDVVYSSGSDGNRYTLTNTLFTFTPENAVTAVANIKATLDDYSFTPTTISMPAWPWLELGDTVLATVDSTETVYFPILNIVMNGTSNITQSIEAKGTRINSDEADTTDARIVTAGNSAEYAAELAERARQAANDAQSSADTAQQTAENAQDAADTAQETIDNYISANEIIVGTQTSTTGSWTGVAGFDELEDGQEIAYWLPYGGSGNATLNLTLSGGGTTGAIPVYYRGNTRVTTHYAAGSVLHLTYRVNASVAGTNYTGWWVDASFDSGNSKLRLEQAVKAKAAISASRFIVGDSAGYFTLAAGITFDVTKPILWASSAINANATGTSNFLAINGCTLRNNLSNITLTQYQTCYLVGTLNGKDFQVRAGNFFTSTVPTTDDGYYYISLGYLYSTYQIYLYPEHPIYKFVDGSFKSLNQVAYDATVFAGEAQTTANAAQDAADNAQSTADEALDTVNNMDIGGRNLLRGTNQYILSSTRSWDDAEWGIGSGGDGTALVSDIADSPVAGVTKSFSVLNNTTGNRDIGQTQVPVNVGDEYTISGYVRLTNGTTEGTMLVRYYTTGGAQIQLSKAITNTGWEYFKVTGTINTLGGSNCCQFGISGAGSIEYCAVKMEDGNMPTSWSPAPEDVDDAITELQDELASYIEGTELIVGTQTAATAAWTGVAGFESLEDQQQITYWLPYAGVSDTSDTLNLTLKSGETTGPIPVYYRGATRATTHFPAGSTIRMTYMMNANVGGTTYTGWWCDASYDSGNTYNRIRFENAVKASVLIEANRLIVGKDGVYFPLAASTPFDITMPILYAISEIKANATGSNNYIAVNSATLRNNASGITLTQYATCYIVGTLAGNVFTPKAAPFLTSTVPTTNDGYYYISLGYLATTYQIYLYPEHPIYKFVDGSFKSLNQVAYEASVSATDAQTAADNAQAAADTAQETAEAAQRTIDDYIGASEIIVGTQTGTTGTWTGVAGFSELEDGQEISYWLPYGGSGNATLNLTLSEGGTTGAIPVYYRGSTRVTTHFGAGSIIHLTYMVNADVAGTSYTGWWADASYDSGNSKLRLEQSIKAKSAISASRFIASDASGYFPIAANVTFDITQPILWADSAISANATGNNNFIAINGCTLRNNLANITLTQYQTCYLVGTLTGKNFKVRSGNFFTSTVPTTNDGYYYISLGYLYSTYQIYLYPEHPIYKYVDGAFKSLNQVAYEASTAAVEAQGTATAAQTAANNAQTTANGAKTAADNAQTAADNAQSTADTAQTKAETAQSTAETAQTTAETAQQTAEEAMATYGTCSTAVGTAAKAVTCDGYNFRQGSTIKVFFATASNVAVPTLNVNGQGAKAIRLKGQALSATANPLMWAAKTYITFIYDGTYFNVVDTPGTYTITCQATAGVHAKETDTMYNAILMNGTTVNVFFTNAYPTAGNLTLKFDSTSARKCFYGDAEISATNPFTWTAGTTISFALEAGFWYVADSGATEKAIEAGRTATNYLYMSTAKGLVISRSPVSNDAGVEALTAYNSRVVSDGFDVYRNGTVRTAHFGANTIVGESGNSQMHIDSTSMKFKDANGEDNLSIENNLTGQSSNVQLWVEVDSTDKSYRNTDGSLNHTRLATLLAGMIDSLQMTSTAGDYVPNTTGIKFYVDIVGWVENDPVTGSYSPMYTQEMDIGGTNSITNGVLTHTAPEMAASDFTEDIAAFDDNFTAGSTGYVIMLNYRLYYPILNIAMTIGTRKADGTKGAGSFSVGRNNEASGTGAVTLGKDLTMTSDYGVAVGTDNTLGMESTNDVAFEVGCGGNTGTGFAVLKSGNIVMSSVNSGRFNDVTITASAKSEFTITFQHPYPSVPFVFLTLNEDNIPDTRVGDYSAMQIYLKEVDNEKFTATIVNGSSRNHTFGFSWFAICAM